MDSCMKLMVKGTTRAEVGALLMNPILASLQEWPGMPHKNNREKRELGRTFIHFIPLTDLLLGRSVAVANGRID